MCELNFSEKRLELIAHLQSIRGQKGYFLIVERTKYDDDSYLGLWDCLFENPKDAIDSIAENYESLNLEPSNITETLPNGIEFYYRDSDRWSVKIKWIKVAPTI